MAVNCKKKKIFSANNADLILTSDNYTLNLIFKISLLFSIFAIPLTLWSKFEDLKIAFAYGYKALYYSEYARRGASITNFFGLWFFPSLLGLLIGSKFEKKTRIFVYLVLGVFVLLSVGAGDRHSWVYKIIVIIWISHISYKSLNLRRFIKYFIIGVISIYILDVIVSLRNIGITISAVIDSLSISNSSLIKVVFEMGQSMNPTLYFHKYGTEFWEYGNTYLLALGGLLTNKILDFFEIPYGILSRHFGEYLGISWGPGFSIVAEPLMNFGPIFAPLFMILIGYLISKLFYLDPDTLIVKKPLKLLFVSASLDALTRINRDSVHVPLKNWFYGVVFFCLLIYIFREFFKKKTINSRQINNCKGNFK